MRGGVLVRDADQLRHTLLLPSRVCNAHSVPTRFVRHEWQPEQRDGDVHWSLPGRFLRRNCRPDSGDVHGCVCDPFALPTRFDVAYGSFHDDCAVDV